MQRRFEDHEERLAAMEDFRADAKRRFARGDKQFKDIAAQLQSHGEQLKDLRTAVSVLPDLIRRLDSAQTKEIKRHIDEKVEPIAAVQESQARQLRDLQEINDKRDGLIPGDKPASAAHVEAMSQKLDELTAALSGCRLLVPSTPDHVLIPDGKAASQTRTGESTE